MASGMVWRLTCLLTWRLVLAGVGEQAGNEARACFETLAIGRRLEQSLASEASIEVMNALELAMALSIERLSLDAMEHMLSAVLASWSSAMAEEDAQQAGELQEEQQLQDDDELASLPAFHHPASRATPTILHERRLHALARYVAKRTQEVPADMCEQLLSHLDALRELGDNEFGALALSCLGLPRPARASLPRLPAPCPRCVALLACVGAPNAVPSCRILSCTLCVHMCAHGVCTRCVHTVCAHGTTMCASAAAGAIGALAYALGRRALLLMSLTAAAVYSPGVQHSVWSGLGPGAQVVWRLRHACPVGPCFQHPLVALARGHGMAICLAPLCLVPLCLAPHCFMPLCFAPLCLAARCLAPTVVHAGQPLSAVARDMRHVTGNADRPCCALGSALLSILPSSPSPQGPGPTRTQRMAMRRELLGQALLRLEGRVVTVVLKNIVLKNKVLKVPKTCLCGCTSSSSPCAPAWLLLRVCASVLQVSGCV